MYASVTFQASVIPYLFNIYYVRIFNQFRLSQVWLFYLLLAITLILVLQNCCSQTAGRYWPLTKSDALKIFNHPKIWSYLILSQNLTLLINKVLESFEYVTPRQKIYELSYVMRLSNVNGNFRRSFQGPSTDNTFIFTGPSKSRSFQIKKIIWQFVPSFVLENFENHMPK